MQANPLVAAYCASKYAIVGLGEALRAELAPQGVGITIACPGTANTKIWDGMRVRPTRFGGAWRARLKPASGIARLALRPIGLRMKSGSAFWQAGDT